MEGLRPPGTLVWNSNNLAKSWKSWKEEFTLYIDLTMPDAVETTKVKLFYYLIGEKGRELWATLSSASPSARTTVSSMIIQLDEYCNPKVNETVERYRFFMRNQGLDENVDSYVTDLKILASSCNFGDIRDSLIRDRLVCGTNSSALRERLLREEKLTLETSLHICRATELSRENSRTLQGQTVEEVHALKQAEERQKDNEILCKFCGRTHERNKKKCPAFGKKCKRCGKENHFAVQCRSRQASSRKTKKVHAVTEQTSDSDSYEDVNCITEANREDETVNQVKNSHSQGQQLFAGMKIGEKLVDFQIDCGATCNIIPIDLLNPDTQLEHTDKVLVMYNKTKLTPLGTCKVKVRNPRNNKLYRLEFQVVDQSSRIPLLGRKASEAMKLIKVQYENILAIDNIVKTEPSPVTKGESGKSVTMDKINEEFEDVFTGDGCMEGEYRIEIDDRVPPVKLPKRRVPVAMMTPLQEELKDLERRGIITPVERSTDWISSMVAVRKPNGKLRICIDPKPLNRALKRSHYPLPTIDDILPEMSKAKVFTVCDVKQGFWHVKLEEESSYLTTFATPFGRFRWLRMPMGISPAPEVFQRKLMHALEGLPRVCVIADDVLITGEGATQEEAGKDHDEKVRRFLTRCRERNIKLNADKFKLRQKEVPYIGHLLTAKGLRVDPEKVRAIRGMPRPTDVKGVQRLVGMVNYLSKFYDHLSDDSEILRQLTRKENLWEWTDIQEGAFQRLKDKIAKAPVLQYYNKEEELTLQCDASDTGLGAALTQKGKPVAFGSRALTPTERGYAQIEKECLAIVFGMEKFHQYTYGREVTVQSDHKPLENIHRKPLLSAPKRLQRMLLRLQQYDISVTYVPGRDMLLADTLSRAYLPESTKGESETDIETVNMVSYLPISAERLSAIRAATNDDTKLQSVVNRILSGWPKRKKDLPSDIRHYHTFQDELSFQDGIVFRGDRAVIPDALRVDITHRIHSSHLGVEGCLRRARECVYWLGMNEEIKTFIAKCDICRSVDPRQQRETLHPHDMASRPWAKVGMDLFSFHNKDYLITVDYYSNFWEVDYLPDTKSNTVIKKLKAHFARQGIPDIVISDNGPQYASQEFQHFSQKWGFEHRTSSPGYPQSNGKAESAVKTAKRLMLKAAAARQDPYLAMLDHRNTPSQGLNTSPAQRLLSRRTRTLLPTKDTLLKPEVTHDEQGLKYNRQRQEKYYNRTAKDMDTLKREDSVRVQPCDTHKGWRPARVVQQVSHRSYEVELESGGVLRRNRRHLRHNPTTLTPTQNTPTPTVTEAAIPPDGPAENQGTVTRSGRQVIRPRYLTDYTQ
ncbi:uncharacterized protein K02A2.6-like [Leucoraja erinacea]|uniref:uncharacterized protein K02A2.6-like n=1 Tax=Leucoraja erinaceus TaxID=7782 RepID=UPI00245510E9|nr:uncharacterized protein K02A2.6-like [Leucoraja erinacea]